MHLYKFYEMSTGNHYYKWHNVYNIFFTRTRTDCNHVVVSWKSSERRRRCWYKNSTVIVYTFSGYANSVLPEYDVISEKYTRKVEREGERERWRKRNYNNTMFSRWTLDDETNLRHDTVPGGRRRVDRARDLNGQGSSIRALFH